MDDRFATTLDVLQSLILALAEELADSASRPISTPPDLTVAADIRGLLCSDIQILSNACSVLVNRASVLDYEPLHASENGGD